MSFNQAIEDLASPDAPTRLKTVRMLKDAAYPEAAVPLAALIADPQESVQLEAIAAELNIFLAGEIAEVKDGYPVIQKRRATTAEAAFSMGPDALAYRPVPLEVLNALRAAARADRPRVALEGLYAFGALAYEPGGATRRDLLHSSTADLSAVLVARETARRSAAARVIGYVFERRRDDVEAVDPVVGDALLAALNDKDRAVKTAAVRALGAVKYERAVQSLTELFTSAKGEVAESALDGLAHIASPSSESLFTAQLSSPSASCRVIAVEGLARLGNGVKLADIQAALKSDRTERVQLAQSFAATILSNASIDVLGEALVTLRLHDQAKRYLVETAPGRETLFARHVLDPDSRIRVEVADVFLRAGDPRALSLVEPLAKDKDPVVARVAERAVARMRSLPPALPAPPAP